MTTYRLHYFPESGNSYKIALMLTCMGLFLSSGCFGFAVSSLFGAGRPFFVPSPGDQVRGARGRGQGTETLAQLGGLPPSVLVFRSALTPEHAEGR